jgi:hypothetical protein
MFARKLSAHLKRHSVPEFVDRIEKEILPILRQQKGFQDVMVFVTPSGSEAFAVSLWERPENAEAFGRGSYAEVANILATVTEGPAQVEVFHVVSSTVHKTAAVTA